MTPVLLLRRRGLVGIASLLLAGTAAVPAFGAAGAGAAPVDDRRTEAAAIQDDIEANGQRIGELAEQFNGAQLRLDQAQATIDAAQARIEAARAEVARIKELIDLRAASVYRRAVQGRSLDGIDYDSAQDLLSRRHYASKQAGADDELLDQLAQAQQDLAAEKATAEAARAAAAAEQEQIEATRREVEAANGEQQQLLDQVNGELATLVAEEQARRDAATTAQAQARYGGDAGTGSTGGGGTGGAEASPNLPAPGAAAGIAIDFAYAQLGKPYVYAASGPDAYDCSGLTMAAYAAAGISLPHYSGAQYSSLPHVSLDAMQPGDLVFWGPGGGSHVGLYIGDGLMIHSPHTGDVVKIAGVYGTPVGAARPGV
jgi:cell wall-associated NlpC family hydrolase